MPATKQLYGTFPIASMPPSAEANGSLQNQGDATPVLEVDIFAGLGLQLVGPAGWAGTITVLGSMDGGASFPITVPMVPWAGGAMVSTFTTSGNWECSLGQITHAKAVAQSAISGGAVTALLVGTYHSKSGRVGAPAANPVPVLDSNNAAFTTAAALAASNGTPGRSVGVNCTTAGNIVLTLSGGSTITLPVNVGWQIFPFVATGFAFSGGGAGSVFTLS